MSHTSRPPPSMFWRSTKALSHLEALDPRWHRLVELRFFAGLSVDETATVLNVSPGTVKRDWGLARAWLFRELWGSRAPDA